MSKVSNFFGRIGKYFRDIKSELKKVVWPTRSQVLNNTGVVIICVIIIGIGIWVLDYVFGLGASTLLQR